MALEELYREVILDHYRSPRNRRALERPNASADGDNPLCGDEVHVDLLIEEGAIAEVGVTGHGCSISQASGSMMGDAIKTRSIDEVHRLTDRFKGMMSIDGATDPGSRSEPSGRGAGGSRSPPGGPQVSGTHQVRRPALDHPRRSAQGLRVRLNHGSPVKGPLLRSSA